VAFELPIFELPLVLLPGEQVPLHIFEERYKRMVGDSLERAEPFGIVLRDDAGARSVGCTAHVTEVLERFEDGRLNIVVTGDGPFRVLDRTDEQERPAAEVEMLDQEIGSDDPEAAEQARGAFADLAERVGGERPDEIELSGQGAFGLAARIELPVETKQELLELPDEGRRMQLLARALEALKVALERADAIAERAGSNGKVRTG
jgi:Lon protease-like protein